MAKNEKPDPLAGKKAPRWLAEMRNSDVDGHHVDRPHGFM